MSQENITETILPSGFEITARQLSEMESVDFLLIDIRSQSSAAYGTIPGADLIPQSQLFAYAHKISQNEDAVSDETDALCRLRDAVSRHEKLVLYCARGVFSSQSAQELRDLGFDAFSLTGGYAGWLVAAMKETEAQPDRAEEVEKSIRKKFHKNLFSRFAKAINEYQLVQENDRIAVCISGGKDSMLMAKLFQELKRHNKFPFELVFLVMDPGYSPANRQIIEYNARLLNIPITVFESDIFDAVYTIEKSPCYLCARMRRGHLYSKARELGCNKIALGHHYDDVIETILMGMLYGGQVQTMMPKLHSTNFEGMELIRPMYLIREEDICHWRDYNGLHFLQCACRFTDTCTTCEQDQGSLSKRQEVKHLIAELKKTNPFIESNIFKSVENVNLQTVIAYKANGTRHHFLENY